jgi:hypothetical protein
MSSPAVPQPPQQPAPPPFDPTELLKFLREQAQANRDSLREEAAANRWWNENKVNYKSLLMLSMVAPPQSQRFDTISLYDELRHDESSMAQTLRKDWSLTLERMRSLAISRNNDSTTELIRKMGRNSCSDVAKDFDLRLNEWNTRPEIQVHDDYGMWEMEFLRTCPSDPKLLRRIGAFMTQTHSLYQRYGDVMVVNKWAGASLDPFDNQSIQDWWKKNETRYSN